jgi:hypothetical protein
MSKTYYVKTLRPCMTSERSCTGEGARSAAMDRGRAEAVLVTAITAWCMHHTVAVSHILNAAHNGHLLERGLVFAHPAWRHIPGNLLPLCGPDNLDGQAAPFSFRVREGSVFLSPWMEGAHRCPVCSTTYTPSSTRPARSHPLSIGTLLQLLPVCRGQWIHTRAAAIL